MLLFEYFGLKFNNSLPLKGDFQKYSKLRNITFNWVNDMVNWVDYHVCIMQVLVPVGMQLYVPSCRACY